MYRYLTGTCLKPEITLARWSILLSVGFLKLFFSIAVSHLDTTQKRDAYFIYIIEFVLMSSLHTQFISLPYLINIFLKYRDDVSYRIKRYCERQHPGKLMNIRGKGQRLCIKVSADRLRSFVRKTRSFLCNEIFTSCDARKLLVVCTGSN